MLDLITMIDRIDILVVFFNVKIKYLKKRTLVL